MPKIKIIPDLLKLWSRYKFYNKYSLLKLYEAFKPNWKVNKSA